MDRDIEQRNLERTDSNRSQRKKKPAPSHFSFRPTPMQRKGTNHGSCFYCSNSVHYDNMDLINGHLVCNPCKDALELTPDAPVPEKPKQSLTAIQVRQKADREMRQRYHQAMKVTPPPHNAVTSPPKPKTMSQRWAEIDTTRLTYLLKGILHLKYFQ